jgi:acyl carrier protein phosphodiesterase
MNYLAHIYLARHSTDAMLGALMGDFVKPNQQAQYKAQIAREIILHRKIDSFTDSHDINLAARGLFEGQRRRYAGILLDVFYDHVLASNWQDYSEIALNDFIAQFYAALHQAHASFPPNLSYAAPRMIAQDWLGSYVAFEGVHVAIHRMSHRLSRNGDILREGLIDLERHYEELSEGFKQFFPELLAYSETQRQLISRLEQFHGTA